MPYFFLLGGYIRTAALWSVAAFAHAHIDSGVSDGGGGGRERNCFRHNCPDSIAARRRTSYGRAVIEIRCPLPQQKERSSAAAEPIVRGFCVAGFSPSSPPQKEGPC